MPHAPIGQDYRSKAKSMRRAMTGAELKLWNELRAHRLMGLPFRRQYPVAGYIIDFACPKFRLAVEVDGAQHGDAENAAADAKRTARLEQDGWTVLRFWNDDVLRDIDAVCQHIVAASDQTEQEEEARA